MPVGHIAPSQVDPSVIMREQGEDGTLKRWFHGVGRTIASGQANELTFEMSKHILMRRYKFPNGKQPKQLVVPKPFWLTLMKMAHKGITAGHQGTTRTTDRILEEF